MIDKAEQLERDAWAESYRFNPASMDALKEAIAIREQAQGPDHPDLIWPLELLVREIRTRHSVTSTEEAAKVGERVLSLRRRVLADAPGELVHAIARLIRLYTFEDDVLDPARVRELEDEQAQLERAVGGTDVR